MTSPPTDAVTSPGTFFTAQIKGVETFDGNVGTFDPVGFRPLAGRSGFIAGTTYTPTDNAPGTLIVWIEGDRHPTGLRYVNVPGWKVGGLHAGFGRLRTVTREPTEAELGDLFSASIAQAKATREQRPQGVDSASA